MESFNQHSDSQDPRSGLGSAEYRAKLLTKLNCLVAVLEVAIAKISRSLDVPGANQERLMRIRGNLENTLAICRRAKETLVSKGEGQAAQITESEASRRAKMSYRDYVELSSIEEYQKFKALPPIGRTDLDTLDMDDLLRQLGDA